MKKLITIVILIIIGLLLFNAAGQWTKSLMAGTTAKSEAHRVMTASQ